ncbi:nitroreductase [Nitratireductor sp. CAU 1489]|uniref:Putative NAD(P)H nitroreductase n=1 Tax=Nitratireductor arenosus TaxID=2682096 RepID=A0A844QG96_9HYPH|nr:nitroreductase [Nitratireductor arenosus]MVA98986.1 nitroreductase [Nitratireductor arenosus]
MASSIIDFLLTRKSPPISELAEPGPNESQIEEMIRAASRVPDHGRLEPWRFILYRGEARMRVGEGLAALAEEREGPLSEARREQEKTRFSRAPLVVGVVSVPRPNPKIPQWEMFLSGGMAAMNLIHAASALGYGANMITNWYSDTPRGRALLGLAPDERVVGFVHIGSHPGGTPDRPRPEASTIVSDYLGPWENG